MKRLVNIKQNLARENVNHELLYDTIINFLPISLKFFDNFENRMQKQENSHEIDNLIKSVNDPLERDILKIIN